MGKEWEIAEVCTEDCPEKKAKIVLSEKAQKQIKTLLRKYPEQEWLAGLRGVETESGFQIDSIFLVEQVNTSVKTDPTPAGAVELNKGIGWIHSHNKMGVFFSEDDRTTALNYPVSIVVNNAEDYTGKIKRQMSCGRTLMLESGVFLQYSDDEDLLKQTEELIQKKESFSVHDFCYDSPKKKGKKQKKLKDKDISLLGYEEELEDWEKEYKDNLKEYGMLYRGW